MTLSLDPIGAHERLLVKRLDDPYVTLYLPYPASDDTASFAKSIALSLDGKRIFLSYPVSTEDDQPVQVIEVLERLGEAALKSLGQIRYPLLPDEVPNEIAFTTDQTGVILVVASHVGEHLQLREFLLHKTAVEQRRFPVQKKMLLKHQRLVQMVSSASGDALAITTFDQDGLNYLHFYQSSDVGWNRVLLLKHDDLLRTIPREIIRKQGHATILGIKLQATAIDTASLSKLNAKLSNLVTFAPFKRPTTPFTAVYEPYQYEWPVIQSAKGEIGFFSLEKERFCFRRTTCLDVSTRGRDGGEIRSDVFSHPVKLDQWLMTHNDVFAISLTNQQDGSRFLAIGHYLRGECAMLKVVMLIQGVPV